MNNIFALEQAILDCWHVTSDIKLIYDNSESLTEDQLANALLGLKELYELKFNHLWNEFEHAVEQTRTRESTPVPPPPRPPSHPEDEPL